MDELLHSTICKHIHFVHCYSQKNITRPLTEHSTQEDHFRGPIHLENLYNKEYSDLDTIKKRVMDRISIMSGKISKCCSIDNLLSAEKLVMSASCTLDAQFPTRGKTLPPIPPNKTIMKQQPFYSTVKRKRKATIRLAKPSREDKINISQILLDTNSSLYTILSDKTIGMHC